MKREEIMNEITNSIHKKDIRGWKKEENTKTKTLIGKHLLQNSNKIVKIQDGLRIEPEMSTILVEIMTKKWKKRG